MPNVLLEHRPRSEGVVGSGGPPRIKRDFSRSNLFGEEHFPKAIPVYVCDGGLTESKETRTPHDFKLSTGLPGGGADGVNDAAFGTALVSVRTTVAEYFRFTIGIDVRDERALHDGPRTARGSPDSVFPKRRVSKALGFATRVEDSEERVDAAVVTVCAKT